jgi:hypothetical protein
MDATTGRRIWRFALLVFLAIFVGTSLCIAAVIAYDGAWTNRTERLLVSALVLGFNSVTIVASMFALSRRRGMVAAVIGVAFALPTLVLILFLKWHPIQYTQSGAYEIWAAFFAAWSISGATSAALALARLPKSLRLVQHGARGAVALYAGLISLAIWAEYSNSWWNDLELLLILGGIVTGCLMLSVPLLHWFNTLRERAAVTTRMRLWLRCPRCGLEQELAAGGDACAQCKLRLRIEIEEERCPTCGYSLYRLTSSNCPECGAPIPAYTAAANVAPNSDPADERPKAPTNV